MTCHSLLLRDADEIEQFFYERTGMKPGYFQLSRGEAALQIRCIELSGVTLMWAQTPGRVRWRDRMTGESLHMGFALESSGPISARGRSVDAGEAQVWMPGREMDLVMTGPYLSLDVGVAAQIVAELGWRIGGDPIKKVPGRHLTQFVRTCKYASLAVEEPRLRRRGLQGSMSSESWRDLILEYLEPILQPWLHESHGKSPAPFAGTRYYQILRQSDEFFDSVACGDPVEIDQLVDSLGVPRRTMFDAYRKLIGIGPRRYFELKRLYLLRRHLKEASKPGVTVAHLATELGFGDLGRLASLYRQQFGENPSKTLRRA